MLKMTVVSLALSAFIACSTAPPPTRSNAQLFSIISEQSDPQTATLTITIKVSGPATQTNVRSAAESAIAERKDQYRHIVVNSYTEEMTAKEPPFAISKFEANTKIGRASCRERV